MTTLLQSFKTYLQQLGYSKGTQYMLPACVSEFIQQQCITDVCYTCQQQIKDFYQWLQERPLKRRSGVLSETMIGHYMYALRVFFDWLQLTGQMDYNPISGLKFKQPEPNPRRPLTIDEITALFAATTSIKERAVLHLFYSCGLRRSEGVALNIQDIHFKEQMLYVREGKGSKRRPVPLTARVATELEAYYLHYRCSAIVKRVKDADAFILTRFGYRMGGLMYNRLLKELTARAGVRQEASLHYLRHSIGTHLLQGGMKVERVRDFLGHAFLETTQVYAKPSPEQIKQL